MSQVIIVSNRLPVSVKKENGKLEFYPSLGGLATGLASYADDKRNLWIGWPGLPSDDLSHSERLEIVEKLAEHNCQPVFLKQRQIDEFYNGYSNTVLWPIFHNLPYKDKQSDERKRWWQAYRRVNEEFAQAVLSVAHTGSRVWVHDYQLLLVPEMIRAERLDVIPGFFLHIPFPEPKAFQKLSEHKKLLHGVLGAGLVGFHTPSYVKNFIDTCQAIGIAKSDGNQLLDDNHVIRVADFPMGIDYKKYASAKKSKAVKIAMRKYRTRYRGYKVIVAVDRLDPSKGLVERLKAYKTFLEKHPQQRGKVVFSLVAAPSRTDVPAYQRLAKKLDALVAEVNKTYGTATWQPVDYINTAIPFEEVTALFRIADVAFIAPLRDGMNLVAKEFVASNRKRGVLILSETAGAAEELNDALIVNPRKPDAVVEALQQALTMRRGELRGRLKRMRRQLSTHTVQNWAKDFVTTLQQPVPGTPKLRTWTLKGHRLQSLYAAYRQAERRLLLLDYDGSLVPFAKDFHDATPPESLSTLLRELAEQKGNDVVVVSGRSAADLKQWFGDLPISLVAEHGAAMRKAGHKRWQAIEHSSSDWKEILQPILEKYVRLTPGARIEVKPHSLVWHYRAAQPYYAQKYTVTIKRVLRPILKKYSLELLQGNKVLEIKNPHISKGMAAQTWLEHDYDFIMSFGDDMTDEELFQALPIEAWTIKVGRRRTAARFRVASHKNVLSILKRLTKSV